MCDTKTQAGESAMKAIKIMHERVSGLIVSLIAVGLLPGCYTQLSKPEANRLEPTETYYVDQPAEEETYSENESEDYYAEEAEDDYYQLLFEGILDCLSESKTE